MKEPRAGVIVTPAFEDKDGFTVFGAGPVGRYSESFRSTCFALRDFRGGGSAGSSGDVHDDDLLSLRRIVCGGVRGMRVDATSK